MIRTFAATVILLFFFGSPLSAQGADPVQTVLPDNTGPALWAGLAPGPHRVGYQKLRTPRGIVHQWYPTSRRGKRLTVRDYLGDAARPQARTLAKAGLNAAAIDSFFSSPLLASPSPLPPDRAFPLVLVAQGNREDAADQVVLCEYLASRGFVVASTPSPMLRTPMEREDQVGEFAETQALDLEAAIPVIAAHVRVDTMHIGAVGYSFGSRAALLLAMRNPRIRAVVSLDGGIGTATAQEAFRHAPSFRADAALPPVLHFYEELDPYMKPDFTLLKDLRIESLVLEPTQGMHHVHFTTIGFASIMFPSLAETTGATPGTATSVLSVTGRTADFLQDRLQK